MKWESIEVRENDTVLGFTFKSEPVYGNYVGIAESGMCKIHWHNDNTITERTMTDVKMMRRNFLKER